MTRLHVARWIGAVMWLTLLSGTPTAAAVSGQLAARPRPVALAAPAAPAGLTSLAFGAVAYRPANAPAGPLPLLVLLHGTDGDASHFLQVFEPIADAHGYALLALKSADWDWDIGAALVKANAAGRGGKIAPDFGADVPRIDAVLKEYFASNAVDPKRVVLVGFSDGAGYALSLGLANPDLFPAVIALSPGFAKVPPRVGIGQRIFIAHGRGDRTIEFSSTRKMAEALSATPLAVRFAPFNGDHQINRKILDAGLAFALGTTP